MSRLQRTQIYLDTEVTAALDRLARERGTTRSDLIREAARRLIADTAVLESDSILGLVGIGHSGLSDVSERHDDYLAADILEEMRR